MSDLQSLDPAHDAAFSTSSSAACPLLESSTLASHDSAAQQIHHRSYLLRLGKEHE